MFRLETTRTTGKDNLFGARVNLPALFLSPNKVGRSARASSPVRQRKVVSKKLFPKNGRLCSELLERCENENLVRKILKGNREQEEGIASR
jgi:hypothetical protein